MFSVSIKTVKKRSLKASSGVFSQCMPISLFVCFSMWTVKVDGTISQLLPFLFLTPGYLWHYCKWKILIKSLWGVECPAYFGDIYGALGNPFLPPALWACSRGGCCALLTDSLLRKPETLIAFQIQCVPVATHCLFSIGLFSSGP